MWMACLNFLWPDINRGIWLQFCLSIFAPPPLLPSSHYTHTHTYTHSCSTFSVYTLKHLSIYSANHNCGSASCQCCLPSTTLSLSYSYWHFQWILPHLIPCFEQQDNKSCWISKCQQFCFQQISLSSWDQVSYHCHCPSWGTLHQSKHLISLLKHQFNYPFFKALPCIPFPLHLVSYFHHTGQEIAFSFIL